MSTPTRKVGISGDGYSAFQHLIDALFLDDRSLMVIVAPDPPTLYCDASRTLADKFMVVAGAVASVQEWKDFDLEWRQALADNDLRYFRMSEFANSFGQFEKGWKRNEKRRREVFTRLTQIVVDHVGCWVGASVSQQAYAAADRIYQLREYAQPFTVCGLTCVGLAHKWQIGQHLDYLPMEYVFEEGDQYAGQFWQRCNDWYGKYPIFREKRDDNATAEEPVTPLQVADIAAYEIGKFYKTVDPAAEMLFQTFRASFTLLGNIPHHWGSLEELTLRAEMNMRKVPKR